MNISDMAKALGVSLKEVVDFSEQHPRVFDLLTTCSPSVDKKELEDLREQLEYTEDKWMNARSEIGYLMATIEELQEENRHLNDILSDNGIDTTEYK